MRIGIDLRSLQEQEYAGIGRYVYQLCEKFVEIDKSNDYFFYFNTIKKVVYPEFTKKGTIIHTKLPSLIFNIMTRYFKTPLWASREQIDIFWQPSFNFIYLPKNIKKVLTIHDLSWLINRRWYSIKMLLWHYLQNISQIIKSADKIIAVSNSTKADIDYFFHIPNKQIRVIYSGINKIDFKGKIKDNIPNKYFLFVGTIEPRKNVNGIIQALEKIYSKDPKYNEYHLVIIGAKGWANKKVHKAIINSKYSDKFHYIGYTSNKQRDYYIKNSLGIIWPSFYEGFGHPPLEGMFRHKPIITGFGSSLPEIVQGNAILVDPYNISDIADAIVEIIKRQGNKEVQIVNFDKYDWTRTANAYIEIFNKLL